MKNREFQQSQNIYGRAAKLNMKFDHSIINSSIATSRPMGSNLDTPAVINQLHLSIASLVLLVSEIVDLSRILLN